MTSRASLAATLDAVLELGEEATRFFPVPGGVVTLVDRDGVLAEGTFGHADLERGIATPVDGRFEIGSISKFFTALAISQLIDEGTLALEDTIGALLPWAELGPVVGSVTITELLTHTSGLPAGADALADDAAEIWQTRSLGLALDSRGHFHYSNVGYQLLGEVVRARTGERVSDVVRARWLDPLGMNSALGDVAYEDRSALVPGYWPWWPNHPWAPGDALARATFVETDSASGNVVATGADMARLVLAILGASDGQPVFGLDGRPVLSSATLERMTTTLAPTGEPSAVPEGAPLVTSSRYGMGINVEVVGGHHCLTHGGGMVGYSTFFLVDRTSGLGVVVLTNANGDSLAAQLLARCAHANLLRALEGRDVLESFSLDLTVRGREDSGIFEGSFSSDRDGAVLTFGADATAAVLVHYRGRDGRLFRSPEGRYVTDHPELRRFYLDGFGSGDLARWLFGDQQFAHGTTVSSDAPVHPIVGRYRCYSPWYPEFRIIERAGTLYLCAPTGVEAPANDEELVELTDGVYRIGADPLAPERLVRGATRDGEVVSVDRGGCGYSRAFTP